KNKKDSVPLTDDKPDHHKDGAATADTAKNTDSKQSKEKAKAPEPARNAKTGADESG
ncbi:MAG: hypothetical protein GY826_44690, partial [Fuerstiella sp.]|nr:hypothetical protein [Fuerstiella sp.]